MDPETAPKLSAALIGCPFSLSALSGRIEQESVPRTRDIIQMLEEQEI
jgi:hypothetical protein